MQYDAAKIGQRLRALRKAGGWSLRALEERAATAGRHLSHSTISQVELGRRKRRSVDVLETLALVLGWPDYETMLTSEAPAADAAAAADGPKSLDNEKMGVSSSLGTSLASSVAREATGRNASASSPAGVVRPRWLRVFRWGSMGDPRRPGDGVGSVASQGAYEERVVPEGQAWESIGPDGFGIAVDNESVANWVGGVGVTIHGGAIAWCNPALRDGVQPGALVVARLPVGGLQVGVYREEEGELFLDTDEPGLAVQERQHLQPEWVIGPVVHASADGPVRRRPRGRTGDHAEPVGPTFVRSAAPGTRAG